MGGLLCMVCVLVVRTGWPDAAEEQVAGGG
jgi:hypothetical protein